MEPEQRGRTSRASSTSSLGREVRCGCQYYQSDSLLPERRALLGRPASRTMQQPPALRCSEHEYEPIAVPVPSPSPKPASASAPVVRITDTDVVPVADSDDSIDDRARLPPELTRAGDVVLPLDGKIEDTAMEGRELVETGDTSEEIETAQQLQERLEERFLSAPTPGAESRTDGEVNTSQVDSLALEELPLRRGARGLPQRLKTQAGKLRTRLRNMQRPTFAFAERSRSEKGKPEAASRSGGNGRSDRSGRSETKRPSRMDRIRSSFSERTRFNLPPRPRFSLPDRSRFKLKKPNIRLPAALNLSLTRGRKPAPSPPPDHRSTESTIGSRKNIFDFSTYPRIFDKKSRSRGDYATSTPKDSRAQSAESATFPRARANKVAWPSRRRFEDPSRGGVTAMEEPRGVTVIPWDRKPDEEIRYMDYEAESPEISERQRGSEEESRERDGAESEAGLFEVRGKIYQAASAEEEEPGPVAEAEMEQEKWRVVKEEEEEKEAMSREKFRTIPRSRSLEEMLRSRQEEEEEEEEVGYDGTFAMVDPRRYGVHKTPSEEEEEEYDDDEEMEEEDEEAEPESAQSDREQQHSSTSSCDRRRRGVIEEIDSDEFFLRASGLSQDDVNLGKYLSSEIRDALRGAEGRNALADEGTTPVPPQRPLRTRSLRKQKEASLESSDAGPPSRPKRRSESVEERFRERTGSDAKHRIVYRAEGETAELPAEPLDDIVVVKPVRRKSRSSQRSRSQIPAEISREPSPVPPTVPTRRKRQRNKQERSGEPICNGHGAWTVSGKPEEHRLAETEAYAAEEEILAASEENVDSEPTGRLAGEAMDLEMEEEYMQPAPVPPKRRSRSRGTSVTQDEDRTSHGAESLPEAGYTEEEIPRDDARDLPGYAVVEKREKPPRPPPPRRRRDKFATAPRPGSRPSPPKRPQRAYSTLAPRRRSKEVVGILTDARDPTLQPGESVPYMEIDSDDGEHKDLRSDEVLSKMQRRPLPAPPRPPRLRKDRSGERSGVEQRQDFAVETSTATQTDPLPDDVVIEEEVTQAKLIVAPSRSGSQIMVSTERIPSPSTVATPPVPPLPLSQRLHTDENLDAGYDTVSLKSPSPSREVRPFEDRHLSAPHLEEPGRNEAGHHLASLRAALFSDEPVRIGNLEVGDLRVDRLSVSQIEAGKIVASEVDALLVTASELKGMAAAPEESLSPSIVKELIAIRSQLEAAAAARSRETRDTRSDVPQPAGVEEKSEEQQKVVVQSEQAKRHTLSVARVEDTETTRTLAISRVEPSDTPSSDTPKDTPGTRSPLSTVPVRVTVQDKSLRILDTESPLSLSPGAGELEKDESRAFPPSPVTTAVERTAARESRSSPERSAETTSEHVDPVSEERRTRKSESKSRSRSQSPIDISRTRQTASPVRSLPPAISVTPDTPDSAASHGVTSEPQPQRAVISYISDRSERESVRESSPSPIPSSLPAGATHLIAFPASQVPPQYFSVSSEQREPDTEPSIAESTRQLIRVLRVASINALRRFVSYATSVVGEESRDKIREVELTLCALLVLVAGLLIFFFTHPRTVTHHHHWDYFNPPK